MTDDEEAEAIEAKLPWVDESSPLYDKYYDTLSYVSAMFDLDPLNLPDYVFKNVQALFLQQSIA